MNKNEHHTTAKLIEELTDIRKQRKQIEKKINKILKELLKSE